MYERCSILGKAETWTSGGTSPVDSLIKPKRDIVEKLEFGCPFKPGTTGEKDATMAEVLMQEAAEEIKRLREDREWQIKQNVRMFTSLEKMAAILPMGCTIRERECFEIVQAALVESV